MKGLICPVQTWISAAQRAASKPAVQVPLMVKRNEASVEDSDEDEGEIHLLVKQKPTFG